ncbi:MAG: hypothetical protein V3S98_02440 [Dehalococcoidia bacterium]
MSTQSSAPAGARFVYPLLIALGVVAAAVGASTIGWISYSYITREELRNPVPLQESEEHGSLPGWIVRT